ncbi:MAG: hypothetical protein ACM3N0_00470 [Chloroflexota bacterium]
MSRFRILTLLATLFALATAFAACGSSSSDPQTVLEEATLQGIESADVQLTLGMDVRGSEGGHLDVEVSGPFQSESEAELPELDMTASAKGKLGGEKVDFEGGLTLLGDRAFVAYQGSEYEVDTSTFSFVRALMKQRTGSAGKSGEVTACQEAIAEEARPADLIDNLKGGGSVDVGGTSTTEVSGDLNVSGALDAVIAMRENPACRAQLSATGALPSRAKLEKSKGEVEGAVKAAHVAFYVGDDHIVRRTTFQMTIEPKKGGRSAKARSVKLDGNLTLTGVNEEQTIAAPASSKPLNALFAKLGINPIELLGLLQGEGGLSGPGGIERLLEGIRRSGGFQ